MDYDDPALRAQLEERMFRIEESHEAAIVLRNQIARYTGKRVITNRHPGSDHFHIEMDQDTAAALLDLIRSVRPDGGEAPLPPLSDRRPR